MHQLVRDMYKTAQLFFLDMHRNESTVHEHIVLPRLFYCFMFLYVINDLLIFFMGLCLFFFRNFNDYNRLDAQLLKMSDVQWKTSSWKSVGVALLSGVFAVSLLKSCSCCSRFKQTDGRGGGRVGGLTGVSIFMAIKCTEEPDIMTASLQVGTSALLVCFYLPCGTWRSKHFPSFLHSESQNTTRSLMGNYFVTLLLSH